MACNINKYLLFIFLIYLIFQIKSTYDTSSNTYCKQGTTLYETNLKLKNDLLSVYNNDLFHIKEFINKFFKNISKNIDKQSFTSLESQRNIILDSLKCNKLIKHLSTSQIYNHNLFLKEIPMYKSKYKVDYYTEEVFYYHHGLRFASKFIRKYIQNKDIIDVGACMGDSLVILLNYTNKRVHLYEISPKNVKRLQNNIKLNNLSKNKYTIHMIGLSNFTGNITLSDKASGGVGIGKGKGSNVIVNVDTLDNEFSNIITQIGFIKIDIEGQGFNFIKGAIEIIKLNRPVICMAIYHNCDEFFKTRNFLESIVEDYIYQYHHFNNCEPWACEFNIFAYPKELI